MEKRMGFGATPVVVLLLAIPLFFLGIDFFLGNTLPFDRWMQYFSGEESTPGGEKTMAGSAVDDQDFFRLRIARLVRGEDRRNLESTGFACDRTYHSIVCVSNRRVRIDTRNMSVYVPSQNPDSSVHEQVFRPYARQENSPKEVTPVHIFLAGAEAAMPVCEIEHNVPAVVFSAGGMGNIFHEMNEMIIPLFITVKQFESKVLLVIEDYNQKFMNKYGSVLARLSAYPAMNPAANGSVHCFPSAVVGLRYHDNLALNSSEIPGGYSMKDFRDFLRQAYGLKFSHISQISKPKPRLMLLSRTGTRRFLNEDEMMEVIQDLGFELLVVKRSKVVSNLNRFVQLINSCSVLVGAHGAGMTNEIFLPSGAVLIQVELIGTEWASNTYYGDTARAMDVHYLRYKIEPEESSLAKVFGRNHSIFTNQSEVFANGGYKAARTLFLDQQNVRVNLVRFRQILVEALSLVGDLDLRK